MSNVNQIYKRTEVIGRGKFGIVYKGIHRITKQVYAIKVLNLDTTEDEVKDVQQEVQFLSHMKHIPNITHYYGSYLNDTKLWIIMDYCAGGSLRTLLKPGRLEEKYIGVIVREVLIALQAIHKQNVIHRDIKAANVLITNEGKVQLCDFGVAAQLTSASVRRNTMAGTPYWMAPEVIMEGTSYDVKADIWSLGITIYEIATGNPPYCEMEAIRAMQMIAKSKPPRLEGKQYSSLLKEIIALCLDENAEERLSAEELLKSKFIKFHKNSPTSLLKEIISRYLLWREKKSSRESMSMNIEDENEVNEIEVKWDFDSLSSNEYIIENDININNIHLEENNNDEFNFEAAGDYDDGDDQFVTGYQGPQNMITYNKNITTNNTYTYNNNVASTLKYNSTMTRKEAPKSLLQLFEERTEEEEEDEENKSKDNQYSNYDNSYELQQISSSIGLHNLNNTTSNMNSSSKVKSPLVEIEIPNMDEIENITQNTATEQRRINNRSRSGTLNHSQSASAVETRKTLDPNAHHIQRRPTMTSNSTNISLPQHSHSQPVLPTVATSTQPLQPIAAPHSVPPQMPSGPPPPIQRNTPSPTGNMKQITSPSRLIAGASTANLNMSPNKTMKARASPTNPSPLLQPLNSSTTSNASEPAPTLNPGPALVSPSGFASNNNIPIQPASQPSVMKSRKNPNLRLQMPTPTNLAFTKLLSSGQEGETNQDENVNQFGVNVSNIPMTMTPLTEKPPILPQIKRKPTISAPPGPLSQSSTTQPQVLQQSQNSASQPSLPFLSMSSRTVSSVSSQSSVDGVPPSASSTIQQHILNVGDQVRAFNVPQLDLTLFMDTEYQKDKIQREISSLLGGFSALLGTMEDKLVSLNE